MRWNKPKGKLQTRKRITSNSAKKTKTIKNKTVQVLLPKVMSSLPMPVEKNVGLLKRLFSNPFNRLSHKREVDKRLTLAFHHLQHEFKQREQLLDKKFQEIKIQQDVLQKQKQKQRKWLIPVSLAGAVGGGYMLFVLTNMQDSMSTMTGDINHMNSHMSNMSTNTQDMSQNMQTMNGNVEKMSGAIRPIGEAAQESTPFIRAFRSFMPF